MSKPYIVCTMHVSIDGKIHGPYGGTDKGKASGRQYYEMLLGENRYYVKHRGWFNGRLSAEDNATNYKTPDVNENAPKVPEGDFIAVKDAAMNYFVIDPEGKLAWESNEMTYNETVAHVVEIISERTSNAYKDMLRRKNISYIIAGNEKVDLHEAVNKVQAYFGVDEILVGGGGVINWSFIQAGLCDEVSIVVSPSADGSHDMPSLFEDRKYADNTPVTFKLDHVEKLKDDALWLRYLVEK